MALFRVWIRYTRRMTDAEVGKWGDGEASDAVRPLGDACDAGETWHVNAHDEDEARKMAEKDAEGFPVEVGDVDLLDVTP